MDTRGPSRARPGAIYTRGVVPRTALLGLVACAAACSFDQGFDGTRYRCGDGERCPDGQSCVASVCLPAAIDAAVDGAPDGPDGAMPPASCGGIALLRDSFDGNGVGHELAAHDAAEPLEPALGRIGAGGQPERGALTRGEREADCRVRHRKPLHDVGNRAVLRDLRLHELEPCRCGGEQLAHLDARARVERGGPDRSLSAALDGDGQGVPGALRPRGDGEAGDGADGGQRLAAETQRADVEQVLLGQLRCRMALDGQREIACVHAAAVVADPDEGEPAAGGDDLDLARAGIDGVLDELLHHARRTLDHLARGDAVDGLGR